MAYLSVKTPAGRGGSDNAAPEGTVLYRAVLYCIVLLCTMLSCSVMPFPVMPSRTVFIEYDALQYLVRYSALLFSALQ